jgi:hypothetical protein
MSNKVTGGDQSGTSDYSATKAPENREHVESTPLPAGPAQLPEPRERLPQALRDSAGCPAPF